jgi:Uma2 family endonuclease
VDEYVRLADPEDPAWDRTELVEGVVYEVNAQYYRHGRAVSLVYGMLLAGFPDDEVVMGVSVRLGGRTLVEPDVMVFRDRDPDDDLRFIDASEVKLAVEISMTTLRRDLGVKLRAYGAAGVPIYWVIDPNPDDASLLVHTEPFASGYGRVRRIALPAGVEGLDLADALKG